MPWLLLFSYPPGWQHDHEDSALQLKSNSSNSSTECRLDRWTDMGAIAMQLPAPSMSLFKDRSDSSLQSEILDTAR